MKSYLPVLLAAAALVSGTPLSAQTLTRGPYLQSETPASLIVRWRTNVATDSRVMFGAAPGNLTQSTVLAPLVTEHIVQLSGLTADTQYYYSIGSTSTALAGNDANHFFKTAPVPGTPKPTHIWVLGDSGTADSNARAVRDSYFSRNGSAYTDLILMLGDNAYNSGTDAEYQAAVFNMYPTILRQSVLWATLGNHDGLSADSATQSGPFYNNFSFPKNGEAGGLPSGTEAYYSFEYANIHFINLESFETDRSANGAMMTWLRNDLAQNTRQWTIAFWHHPPYTKGSHDSDTETELIEMRQNALPILEAAGVDLVLCGHSHSYERSFLIDGHYGLSSTFKNTMKKDAGDGRVTGNGPYAKPSPGMAPHEGAVYAVAGSSGQASGGPLNYPAMFISLNLLGSMILDVNGSTLDAIFLDSTGTTRDSFRMTKGGLPAGPTLTGIAPNSGSQNTSVAVTLSGTNFVAGATVSVSGAGVTATSVSVVSATQITATLNILAGAAPGARNLTVTTPSGTAAPQNFTVASGSAVPVLTSLSPASGAQGSAVSVTLNGSNFVSGATVGIGGSNVAASNVTVVSTSQITASFTIGAAAVPGPYNVSVTTPGGTSGTAVFTVTSSSGAATLTSITPASGAQGSAVPVTISGTNFTSGTSLRLSGAGAGIGGSAVVVSSTQITATFTLSATAALGVHNVYAVTGTASSNILPFTVNTGSSAPTLTSIAPSNAPQGSSVNVTLTGTNFVSGAIVAVSGSGVVPSNVAVASPTQITATLTVGATAAPGNYNVTVSTSGGTSVAQTFNVTAVSSPPVLTSVSPNGGTPGAVVNVTLNGGNFVSGTTVGISGTGLTASNVAIASANRITATIAITAGAALGQYNLSVTSPAGTSGTVPFTVSSSVPVLTSISPATGTLGASVNVTLSGGNFTAGASVAVSGAGVTASNISFVSSTQITATLTIAATATTGQRSVTVTTPGGTSGIAVFTVNGTGTGPTLTSVSPPSGNRGTAVAVTLIGTNFTPASTVRLTGLGASVGNSQVVISSIQITVTFTLSSSAALGIHNVSVVTSVGVSNILPFTVN